MIHLKTKNRKVIIGISIILAIAIILYSLGILDFTNTLSIISLSPNVQLENGKVFWVYSGTVNSIDEKVTFTNKPSAHNLNNGTTVTPQKSLSISLSKLENSCIYRTTSQQKKLFLGLYTYKYYTLNNPEREALIKVEDGNGKSAIIDASIVDSETFTDSDGKGSVTVQTQGFLGGKVNCPSYADVAVIQQDGQTKYVNRNKLESDLANNWVNYVVLPVYIVTELRKIYSKHSLNTAFVNSFSSAPSFNGNEVKGNLDFGSGFITITADQDYFNSVVFTPPKDVYPSIDSVNINSEVKADGTTTMKVIISNRQSSQGTITVKTTSNQFTITPSSTNVLLKDTVTINYNLKASKLVQDNVPITVQACSTNQFGSTKCDTETTYVDIIADNPFNLCGDKLCQGSESFTTCPSDCKQEDYCEDNPQDPQCNSPTTCNSCDAYARSALFGWLDDFGITKTPLKCNTAGGTFFPPKLPQSNTTCSPQFIKYLLVFVALIFGTLFSWNILNNDRRFKIKNKKLALGLAIVIGLGLAIASFYLWFVAVIGLIVLILFRVLIGALI